MWILLILVVSVNNAYSPDVTIQELNNELILQLSYRSASNNYKFHRSGVKAFVTG